MIVFNIIFLFLLRCIPIYTKYMLPETVYSCPQQKLLLNPCTCDAESDDGVYISCNRTNIASMSLALNNLATFKLPVQILTINSCYIARLFGTLLYKLNLKTLQFANTPLESIDEYSFLGVNNSLNELHLINTSLLDFPSAAFKILGNLSTLNIDGHNLTHLGQKPFVESHIAAKLLKLHVVNGQLQTPPIDLLQPLGRLKILDLHSNHLADLKRNQFKGLKNLEFLDLSYNNITKIDGTHIGDLTKLSRLNLSDNNIKELTRGAFARNTVLRVLNMSSNKIKKLDTNSFKGMRFLRRLFLSDNLIADIGRDTFSSLQRIGTIDLARNFIKKIDYKMFFQLNFVELIDLSNNKVTEVQKLAFKDLYLTTINLSQNNISKIENGAFENCANMTKLDLSYNQLETLSKNAFDSTTYATELQFSYNYLTSLNQVPLHNMTGLKVLNVSHNLVTTIPKGTFPKLYELHTIDLSYNNVSDIFNSVFQTLFSLRTLDLSYNSLTTLKPNTFGTLPTLLVLNISNNQLDNVARSSFTKLTSNRELILNHNQLTTLFTIPISLSYLDLSYNQFAEIQSKTWPSMNSLLHLDISFNKLNDNLEQGSFTNLIILQKLNLNYNNITRPPWAAINELNSLQYIYLEGNNLTQLHENAFGKMPILFELIMSDNNINMIYSKAFSGLLQLIHLKINHNDLTSIPNEAFQGLVALRELNLSYNKLSKLDNKTHGLFEPCLSLEKLDLSHNKIAFITKKTFPSDPYYPYKLREVDLSFNSIAVITSDLKFGTLKLEILNMSHNSIGDIRQGVIGNLTGLKSFDLSYNQLQDISSDLEYFRLPENISELRLAGNKLTELPVSHLIRAEMLKLIDLRHNELEHFPVDLIKKINVNGTIIMFEGNRLNCDCSLLPLLRYFKYQLDLNPFYKAISCDLPQYLTNKSFYQINEDQLSCIHSNNKIERVTTTITDNENLSDTSDLELRQITLTRKKQLKAKWRVLKQEDIADTLVFIRNTQQPADIIYQEIMPYSNRMIEIPISKQNWTVRNLMSSSYEICFLAKTTSNKIRKFYTNQCRNMYDVKTSSCQCDRSQIMIVTVCIMLLSIIS